MIVHQDMVMGGIGMILLANWILGMMLSIPP